MYATIETWYNISLSNSINFTLIFQIESWVSIHIYTYRNDHYSYKKLTVSFNKSVSDKIFLYSEKPILENI